MEKYGSPSDMTHADKQRLYDISNDHKIMRARFVEQEQELNAFWNVCTANRPINQHELEVSIFLVPQANLYLLIFLFF